MAKNVLLCSGSVELKTDSRSALFGVGFTTELNVLLWKFALSGPYQILITVVYKRNAYRPVTLIILHPGGIKMAVISFFVIVRQTLKDAYVSKT